MRSNRPASRLATALLLLALPSCGPGDELPNPGDTAVPLDASVRGDDAGACTPSCSGLTPYCNATAHCVACTLDAHCPLGTFCKKPSDAVATCTPGCTTDDRCPADAGAKTCCAMTCVDTATDVAHCGACGKACTAPHATPMCAMSACATGPCDKGWGDCNKDPQDGCEANLHADPNNCTACGTVCAIPNATAGCADGCFTAACKFGFDDCNLNPQDGCETSTSADPNNCGKCGTKCAAIPNGTVACTVGNCIIGACNLGFADCDALPANGCEISVNGDAKNCGACGKPCPVNTPFCNGGVCGALSPKSCKDILDAGLSQGDGVYSINPDGNNSFQAWCDMSSDGGGWTAFFTGINGSPNVFAHFEDVAVLCPDPATKCLRRLPAAASLATDFLVICGNASVKFRVNQLSLAYLRDGVQGGNWQNNSNLAAISGNVNTNAADQLWTGQANNKGWIVANNLGGARIFASSYNLNNSWDRCNGLPDVISPIKLLYR